MAVQKKDHPRVYFLSVGVENVRCFGEAQTLDLSDGNGRPARCTVITGDKDTGKTTLLRAITAWQPEKTQHSDSIGDYHIPGGMRHGYILNRHDDRDAVLTLTAFVGRFADRKVNTVINKKGKLTFKTLYSPDRVTFPKYKQTKIFTPHFSESNPLLLAYGASRHMGSGSLSDSKNPDPVASLFDNEVTLIDAEEWLLQADFAVKSSEGEIKKLKINRYEKVK